MPEKRWKVAERRAAKFFGCLRTILSGSSSHVRNDETNADTNHKHFFIEVKQRENHGVWNWYREAKAKAKREKKMPVIVLDEVGAPGTIICVHQNDLYEFCKKFLAQGRSVIDVR